MIAILFERDDIVKILLENGVKKSDQNIPKGKTITIWENQQSLQNAEIHSNLYFVFKL